jgi:multidrug transporter EmrE-like cation transporter
MTRDRRSRVWFALRYALLVGLGVLTGVLISRLLFQVVFERGGPFVTLALVLLVVGIMLLARALWRGRLRP